MTVSVCVEPTSLINNQYRRNGYWIQQNFAMLGACLWRSQRSPFNDLDGQTQLFLGKLGIPDIDHEPGGLYTYTCTTFYCFLLIIP